MQDIGCCASQGGAIGLAGLRVPAAAAAGPHSLAEQSEGHTKVLLQALRHKAQDLFPLRSQVPTYLQKHPHVVAEICIT